MIKLLGRQTSGNVQKVIFALEEIGTRYTREDYGRDFGNTTTEAYRKLNPNSKVPTLIDGDAVIWESNTILRYLAATYAPALTGATPTERSQVERWQDWLLAALNAPSSVEHTGRVLHEVLGSDAGVSKKEPAAATAGMSSGEDASSVTDTEADEMEEHLRGLGYLE